MQNNFIQKKFILIYQTNNFNIIEINKIIKQIIELMI